MIKEKENDQMDRLRNNILSNNKAAREQYAQAKGIEASMFEVEGSNTYVDLPLSIYTGYDDADFDYNDDDDASFFNVDNNYDRSRVLTGNLASIYDKL